MVAALRGTIFQLCHPGHRCQPSDCNVIHGAVSRQAAVAVLWHARRSFDSQRAAVSFRSIPVVRRDGQVCRFVCHQARTRAMSAGASSILAFTAHPSADCVAHQMPLTPLPWDHRAAVSEPRPGRRVRDAVPLDDNGNGRESGRHWIATNDRGRIHMLHSLLGSVRRECLNHVIISNECASMSHGSLFRTWIITNGPEPHLALGKDTCPRGEQFSPARHAPRCVSVSTGRRAPSSARSARGLNTAGFRLRVLVRL